MIAELPATIVLTVRVIESDILHGVPEDCHRCPVARAVARALQATGLAGADSTHVDVGAARVYVRRGLAITHIGDLAQVAQDFIQHFDLQCAPAIRPLTFTLRLEARR